MIHRQTLLLFLAYAPLIASAEIVMRGNGLLLDHTLEINQKNDGVPAESKPDPAGDDLILFHNGDLMHGTFGGIDQGLTWKRKDISRPIKFGIPSIKQVIFKSTRRLPLNKKSSFITLTSGDRIPGEILSLDQQNLSLKSPVIGNVTIPRNLISTISPNPFDGELHYLGPYTSDGWLTLEYLEKQKDTEEGKEAEEETKEKETPSSWIHSGTSFYSQSTTPLILADANLPDVGRVTFNIAWKGRISMTLALHSDLTRVLPAEKKEEEEEEEAEKATDKEEEKEEIAEEPAPLLQEKARDLRQGKTFQSIPWIDPSKQSHSDIFGTGYTLSLQPGYSNLARNHFSKNGTPRQERLYSTRSNSSLGETGEAKIELRFDRKKSLIMLFINGTYHNQWNDLSGYIGEGTALGFMNRSANSKVRISEITISTWAGAVDSARSMEHSDRDIVLLTNGTDRFSGELSHISEGLAHLKTGYSHLQIPLKDLSLINFKKTDLIDIEADENMARFAWKTDPITVVYQPYGLIQVTPLSSTTTTLTGNSPFLGDLTIKLEDAIMLRFSDDSPDLSDWFDDF